MPESRVVLECDQVGRRFGRKRVLHDVQLRISRGQIVALVGPSGCGKSTLLQCILGTLEPSQGSITVHRDGVAVPVEGPGRDRGVVYQHYSLYPFLTAVENVAFGPLLDETTIPFRTVRLLAWRRKRREHLARAAAMLSRMHIRGAAQRAYPDELSGGMRQRVAIAQALIMRPDILLLDEPFGALDEATRESLQRMLLELYQENVEAVAAGASAPHTIVIITHELTEALYVADRDIGLSQHWEWADEGHDECPGATVVYDRIAPVFEPGDVKRYETFVKERDLIREVVFEPARGRHRGEHITFWEDVRAGRGEGVLAR